MRLLRGAAGEGGGERAERLLDEATALVEEGEAPVARRRAEEGLRLARRARPPDAGLAAALAVVLAAACNDAGDHAAAERAAGEAIALDAEEPAAWYERAVAAYRRARLDDAERCFREAVRLDPDDAASWHGLGRVLVWKGERRAAEEPLSMAATIDPEHFHRPVWIASGEFDRLAAEAVRGIPAGFRARLGNTIVAVEELPDPGEVAEGFDPDTLGVYEGATVLADEGMPERIVLFQRNHELVCGSLGELREELRRTVLHEVGHHFGMDEHELPW